MFIAPLRIAKVLEQQIRTKTWDSLREIYFFSQQKKVPFGKGGGSQYGLTSPGWTWKAVERKTNVSKWKKSLLLARLTRKDYERVYRPKLYNYIATYTFTYRSHCSRFRWNLYPQKSQITTPNINTTQSYKKAQSSYYTHELLDVIKASNYHVWHTPKMRARSLVFFSLLRQKFMNVTEIYNQFNKWKGLLQAILTVFQKSLVNTVRSKDARVCHS